MSWLCLKIYWLIESNRSLYNLEGYVPLHRVRKNKHGGGVSLMIDQDVEFKERNDLSAIIDDVAESIFVEVPKDVFKTRRKIIIGEIYRPPGESVIDFNQYLQTLLTKLGSENAMCYLLGDFNINLLNANKHNATSEYINCMSSYCFAPLINRPTRVTEHSASLIDNIYTNSIEDLNTDSATCGILFNDISDNFPVFHIQKAKSIPSRTKRSTYKQVINRHTIQKLKDELSKQNWGDITDTEDVNTCYSNFTQKLEACYKRCIPVRKSVKKDNHKPWVTSCILSSIKQKNKLYLQYIKNPCITTENSYKSYRNKLTHLLRKAERSYVRDFLKRYHDELKKSWQLINNIISKNTNHTQMPKSIEAEMGSTITEPKAIANFLTSILSIKAPPWRKRLIQLA